MIADLKPYAEYKESRLPWLGRVPGHWDVRRMKSAVTNVIEQTVEMTSDEVYVALEHVESWTGKARPQSGSKLFAGQVKRFRQGDVLFGKLRPYLAKVTRIANDGVCAGEFFVLRPTDDAVSTAYLAHQLRAKQTIDVINGSTFGAKMPRADWQFCGNLPIPLPPPDEQAAIVRFLDWATGRLERAIRAKRKVIALLGEQKQAIIHRAVTRGLDPSVPLKPSGIPWLGEIPEHWEVQRLKRICRVQGGYAFPSSAFGEAGVPVVRMNNLRRGTLNFSVVVRIPESECVSAFSLQAGDILYGLSGSIGATGSLGNYAVVSAHDLPAMLNQRVARFVPKHDKIVPGFLIQLIQSSIFYEQVLADTTGTAQFNVSTNAIENVAVGVPPLEEQAHNVAQVEGNITPLNSAISRLQREIDLLREYRTRLVADVVTGKLDVREAAARLPDEAPLDPAEDEAELGDDTEAADEEASIA